MSKKTRCETCRYWRQKESKPWGFCHRFPPQLADRGKTDWPETGANDWCGEQKPKDE